MVSYFQSTRPDLSLMSPSLCIKSALWVNKCTHRVTMKDPNPNSSACWRKFTFSRQHLAHLAVQEKQQLEKLNSIPFLMFPFHIHWAWASCSQWPCTGGGFHFSVWKLFEGTFFFRQLSKCRLIIMNNNLSRPLYFSSWAFMLVLKLLFSHHVPKCWLLK